MTDWPANPGATAGSRRRRLLARRQRGGRGGLRRHRAERASTGATTAGRPGTSLTSLLDCRSRPTWSFPPRPWTSHVRWIAPSPHDADLLLVGIELGGLMRSTDRGETWHDHRPGAQRDVHSLAWHPDVTGRVRGRRRRCGWSEDAGDSWQAADEGRDRNYTWSVAVDPDDPECWYVSASTGPYAAHGGRDPQARIYGRRDGALAQRSQAACRSRCLRCRMRWWRVRAVFVGLADGQLWEQRGPWRELERDDARRRPAHGAPRARPRRLAQVTWRTTFIPSFVWLSTVSVGWPGRRPARSEGLSSAPGRRRSVRSGR